MALRTGFAPVIFRSTGGCSDWAELTQQKNWSERGESDSLDLAPEASGQPMAHIPMADATRIARVSPEFQSGVSTCFTKRPWQIPRELHPADLALEASPSLRAWNL
jgi:hypothetical protein